ncbi:MAG: polysaccharide deacetylase family protein [Nitrospirae bacterium]|nr:polysaccharide deacetylase family protein [Nitrospirota bacterium]
MKISITVDVEKDIGLYDSYYGLDDGLPEILRLFRRYGVAATFFVSGEIFSYKPAAGLISEALNDNHEIASHGYTHTDYRGWPSDKINDELNRSKKIIGDIFNIDVKGFRAPQFLINEAVIHAAAACGFLYDSSLPDTTGISAARHLRRVQGNDALLDAIKQSGLMEFQIDSIPKLRVPHGLLWVNHLSLRLYKVLWRHMKQDRAMFYLHPFDLAKDKGRLRLDLKRKIFYLPHGNRVAWLLEALLDFWKSEGVSFVRLQDEL